jgi:hypothetical protein
MKPIQLSIFLKLAVLSLCLLGLNKYTHCQIPIFPTDSATWHVLDEVYSDGGGRVISRKRLKFEVGDDTLVYGKIYHTIYEINKGYPEGHKLTHIYRVDGQKVYVDSFLVLDFSLEVGDTLFGLGGSLCVAKEIDSVLLHDGHHKRIRFYGCASIIEGIGSKQTPFNIGYNVSNFSETLICFSYKGTTLYPEYSDSTCNVLTKHLGNLEVDAPEISIFPNPCIDHLFIDSDFVLQSAVLINVNGQKTHQWNTKELKNKRIKIDVPPGLYTLYISTNSGLVIRKIAKL